MQQILYFLKNYKKEILIAILLILAIFLGVACFFKKETELKEEPLGLAPVENVVNEVNESKKVEEETFAIDIKGAVKKPGVYYMNENSIVMDAILKAGGFKDDAYQNGINLSKKLEQEMVLYVYTNKEIKDAKKENNVVSSICPAPSYIIKECIEKKESIITSTDEVPSNKEEDTTNQKNLVNINSASIKEFTSLSGIGEAKAQTIIDYRNTNGNFKSIEDIKKVKGIGDAIYEKIKDHITI